jgi:pilus assembly protein CpaB
MDRKKVILLVAALLIAGITAFMARSMFAGAGAPKAAALVAPAETGPQVLVATRSLPVGTIITADAFRYQPWPKELIEAAYFIQDGAAAAPDTPGATAPDELVGTVVRNAITAGQPITQGSLVKPGDRGFLAAALSPGMRAITVPVSALTGVAGFVFPGDRVDLMLTQSVAGDTGPALKVSETIMRNLRVLATDQRSRSATDDAGNTVVRKFKLVTFEVTPSIAEKITVAQSIGTLSLSLRSIADNAAELEQALALGTVNVPSGASAAEEERIIASLAKHPSVERGSYSTGGQVSRFQRSTIPAQLPVAVAVEQARVSREVSKVVKGQVVRVSRGGSTTEVDVNPR